MANQAGEKASGQAKQQHRRNHHVYTDTTGLEGDHLIVARHPQKREQDAYHDGHGNDKLQRKGHGIEQKEQKRHQAQMVIDNVVGDLENARHQEYKHEKENIEDKWRCHFPEDIAVDGGIDLHGFPR